ncbi:MAG: hypothetical protein OEV94_00510 [Deltaproteobacteria bacterium]|nr:hypothetical protein [Deltaproteobacteria bacterium]
MANRTLVILAGMTALLLTSAWAIHYDKNQPPPPPPPAWNLPPESLREVGLAWVSPAGDPVKARWTPRYPGWAELARRAAHVPVRMDLGPLTGVPEDFVGAPYGLDQRWGLWVTDAAGKMYSLGLGNTAYLALPGRYAKYESQLLVVDESWLYFFRQEASR